MLLDESLEFCLNSFKLIFLGHDRNIVSPRTVKRGNDCQKKENWKQKYSVKHFFKKHETSWKHAGTTVLNMKHVDWLFCSGKLRKKRVSIYCEGFHETQRYRVWFCKPVLRSLWRTDSQPKARQKPGRKRIKWLRKPEGDSWDKGETRL